MVAWPDQTVKLAKVGKEPLWVSMTIWVYDSTNQASKYGYRQTVLAEMQNLVMVENAVWLKSKVGTWSTREQVITLMQFISLKRIINDVWTHNWPFTKCIKHTHTTESGKALNLLVIAVMAPFLFGILPLLHGYCLHNYSTFIFYCKRIKS